MAWQRTALGVGGLGALLLHQGGPGVLAVLTGGLGLAAGLTLLLTADPRYRRTVRLIEAGQSPASPVLARVMSTAALFLAIGAIGLVLTRAP